jgi:hypothetical protein
MEIVPKPKLVIKKKIEVPTQIQTPAQTGNVPAPPSLKSVIADAMADLRVTRIAIPRMMPQPQQPKQNPVIIKPPMMKIPIPLMTTPVDAIEDIENTVPPPPGDGAIKFVRSQIISASRRTDIPNCYMPMMIKAIRAGSIDVSGPYGYKARVSLSPVDVKLISWWSKDYRNWLELYQGSEHELLSQFHHIFNFTLTGGDALEPGVKSSFDERLGQLRQLAELFGSDHIKLRFDPIVFYRDQTGQLLNNLQRFETVISTAASLGIKSVIFAFCLAYPHIAARMRKYGLTIEPLTLEDKHRILNPLLDFCESQGVQMESCCGSELIGWRGITGSKCVDGTLARKIIGHPLTTNRKDPGQRKNCGCVKSTDIGSYSLVCSSKCHYCYVK